MDATRRIIARICFLLVLVALGFIVVGISLELFFGYFFDMRLAATAFFAAIVLAVIRSVALHEPLPNKLPNACDACGYDLTGNTSGVCPECGRGVGNRFAPPGATVPPEGETVRPDGRK